MSLWQRLRSFFSTPVATGAPEQEPETPAARDAMAAIRELSLAVQNDPNAVEIYLALGNLYRQQGEIERAVHIRNTLIVRPSLAAHFKARAYFELGRDFRRSGVLDRAQQAFEEARTYGADPQGITQELAHLAVDSGNFDDAAQLYGKLRNPGAQAHFLAASAYELLRTGHAAEARARFGRAVKVYPAAVEAWCGLLILHLKEREWRKARHVLRSGLESTAPGLRFLLFEAILNFISEDMPSAGDAAFTEECTRQILAIALEAIENEPPELLLLYYAALFSLYSGDTVQAGDWLAKALVIRPDFWAARMELLEISLKEQSLSPVFKAQLEIFLEQAHASSRFVCRQCGFRSNRVFYLCPRCRNWHSIAFRIALQD